MENSVVDHFSSGSQKMEKVSTEHLALKVFVVLKGIVRYLSDSELQNARLVDRQWNFAAMSELVSRKFHLPTIKLYSSSSNQFRDRDYAWYLQFENSRRKLWTRLYGADCPIIEFQNLHFGYLENNEDLHKIVRSSWLKSLTSLTLSICSDTCQGIHWLLPSFPNLQDLSYIIISELDTEPASSDLVELNPPDGSNRSTIRETNVEGREVCSKLHSVSICFEEACSSFPCFLLDPFSGLQTLTLKFTQVATLIKCAEAFSAGTSLLEIENFKLALIHQQIPNLQQQVEDAELHSQALAAAAAKLCNRFRVRNSLKVVSMIPAASFFSFLNELTATDLKQIEFEIAAPIDKHSDNSLLTQFIGYLVREIYVKYPALSGLHLEYLQYYSQIHSPINILPSEQNLNLAHRAQQWNLKKLHLSTSTAAIEAVGPKEMLLPIPHCQIDTMFYARPYLKHLVEVVAHVSDWQDCVAILDTIGTYSKCVKKLVLQGSPQIIESSIASLYLFPAMNRSAFPTDWYYGKEVSRQYEGLPGIQSLEMFCIEQFGVFYNPFVVYGISKMPRLKSIHLDADFNGVVPPDSFFYWAIQVQMDIAPGKHTDKWPSSVEHVQILSKYTRAR